MKIIPFSPTDSQKLLQAAKPFALSGNLSATKNHLTYLKIDDNFIHHLFPLLPLPNIQKPDYFGDQLIGAHISVIYPEENIIIHKEELNQTHLFSLLNGFSAELGKKKYVGLLVAAPSLLAIRKKYGLPDLLSFKGESIPLHITVGVELLAPLSLHPKS